MATPLAQAFVQFRIDASKIKPDVEKEIDKVDGAGAGTKVGKKFGGGVGSGLKSTIGTISGVLLAAGVTKFGKDSIAAYKDAQSSQEQLQGAYKRFPALADANIGSLRNLNSQLERQTGFDDDAAAAAQANLAQYHLTGAQIKQLTPLLEDYAAKTGQDLPSAATALGKAVLGQGRALKSVGINFKDTHTTAGNFNQIMTGLRANVGGFATDQGKTAAGQSKIMSAEFGELEESVGAGLVPALTTMAGILIPLFTFVAAHIGVFGLLVAGIGGAAAAAGIYNVAVGISAVLSGEATASTVLQTVALGTLRAVQGISTAAQWAWNAALTANPIGLVIVAIAALIAIFIVAWKHSETFRAIVLGALHGIEVGFFATVGFIRAVWGKVNDYVITPVRTAISWIGSHVGDVVGFFKNLPGKIRPVIGGVVSVLTSPFRTAFNAIADLWNGTAGQLSFHIPDWVPKIGGKGFSMPKLPHLALGTGNFPGGFALFGEHGPEIGYVPPGTAMAPHGRMPAGPGGPMLNVGKVELLRGGPEDVADALVLRLRAAGGL